MSAIFAVRSLSEGSNAENADIARTLHQAFAQSPAECKRDLCKRKSGSNYTKRRRSPSDS